MSIRFLTASALGLGLSVSIASGNAIEIEPIQVGNGLVSSFVQIEFFEGQTFVFEVAYSDAEMRGFDLLVTIDQELGDDFTLEYLGPPDSAFVTGLGYDGFLDQGDGSGGDDWWRYWIREDVAAAWEMSSVGPSDRIVDAGSWDGWVFGRNDAPVAVKLVPAPPATLALAGLLIVGRRRRREG